MARYRIGADLEFESLTPGELVHELDRRDRHTMDALRAIKPRRLPPLFGKAAGGVLALGGDSGGPQIGPSQGNIWMIRLLSINGLTFGTTPDVANIQFYGSGSGYGVPGGINWWQLNGNSFATGFGMFELWMEPGEYLAVASQGAFAATGQIVLVGSVIQVPAEMVAKLIGGR
jgi:hypothetical protein